MIRIVPGKHCLSFVVVLVAFWSLQSMASNIRKCQDEQGQWHYGTYANEACSASEVITLSSDGVIIDREAPPPTEDELEEQDRMKQQAAEDAELQKMQQARDQNLVQTYGTEAMVISTRDRKLSAIRNNLDVTRRLKVGIESDLEELRSREQTDKVRKLIREREEAMEAYNEIIDNALAEISNLEQEYDRVLTDFREALIRLDSGS